MFFVDQRVSMQQLSANYCSFQSSIELVGVRMFYASYTGYKDCDALAEVPACSERKSCKHDKDELLVIF